MTPTTHRASPALRSRLARRLPPLRRILDRVEQLDQRNQRLVGKIDALKERVRVLQDQNRALTNQVAQRAAGGQDLAELGYVFIVTYGRSGSTLLTGILNSTPGFLLRGENGDALHSLFLYHHKLAEESGHHAGRRALTTRDAWYGIDQYDRDGALLRMRELVVATLLRPGADTRVTGFKEIRWWHKDWSDYFDFLQQLFPGARFIINTRSHESVMKSKWYADATDPAKKLVRYEAQLDQIEAKLGSCAFRVRYDDYVSDPASLRPLFEWLGAEFDSERIAEVLAVKHSS